MTCRRRWPWFPSQEIVYLALLGLDGYSGSQPAVPEKNWRDNSLRLGVFTYRGDASRIPSAITTDTGQRAHPDKRQGNGRIPARFADGREPLAERVAVCVLTKGVGPCGAMPWPLSLCSSRSGW